MFYKVTGFMKNNDVKEMIVKASSKADAEKLIPAAKAFLFPEENETKLQAQITNISVQNDYGMSVPHYKIKVERMKESQDDQTFENGITVETWWEDCVEAENAEKAITQAKAILNEDGVQPDTFEFYADSMTIEECVKEEERFLRQWMENKYFSIAGKDKMPAREYYEYRRKFDSSKNPEQYYKVLKVINRANTLRDTLMRQNNVNEMTVAEFENTVAELTQCKTNSECRKILQKTENKYKKGDKKV